MLLQLFCVDGTQSVGRLPAGLASTLEVLDILEIIQSFDHDKSSSVSQK